MYKDHASLQKPPSEKIRIWRFMDFTKYVNLLDSKCLYFNRSDLFEDLFEGTVSKPTIDSLTTFLKPYSDNIGKVEGALSYIEREYIKGFYLNCWHINEFESDAMWKIYATDNKGVAIQSTFEHLKQSFVDEKEINMGLVRYINYQTEEIDMTNVMMPLFHKRLSYKHENELRAIVPAVPKDWYTNSRAFEQNPHGIYVKVDLDKLIEKIYVSPRSPKWFADQVKSVSNRFGLDKPIEASSLSERPLFR